MYASRAVRFPAAVRKRKME